MAIFSTSHKAYSYSSGSNCQSSNISDCPSSSANAGRDDESQRAGVIVLLLVALQIFF